MEYIKPIITLDKNLSEGIYMASGDVISRCKSKYMLGKPVKPTYNSISDGYKLGRGCEGCQAWNGSENVCRLITEPDSINWDGDFRPSWEIMGKKPDELGW